MTEPTQPTAEREASVKVAAQALIRAVDDDNGGRLSLLASVADELDDLRAALSEQKPPQADERDIRRMLCASYAGACAYMDDGEAQDNRTLPCIDFLRDAPGVLRQKMFERATAALSAPPQPPEAGAHTLSDEFSEYRAIDFIETQEQLDAYVDESIRDALSAPPSEQPVALAAERMWALRDLSHRLDDVAQGITERQAYDFADEIRVLLGLNGEEAAKVAVSEATPRESDRRLCRIFNHWNEFGPEHGFAEVMDRAQHVATPPSEQPVALAAEPRKPLLHCQRCGLTRIFGEGPCDECGTDDFRPFEKLTNRLATPPTEPQEPVAQEPVAWQAGFDFAMLNLRMEDGIAHFNDLDRRDIHPERLDQARKTIEVLNARKNAERAEIAEAWAKRDAAPVAPAVSPASLADEGIDTLARSIEGSRNDYLWARAFARAIEARIGGAK